MPWSLIPNVNVVRQAFSSINTVMTMHAVAFSWRHSQVHVKAPERRLRVLATMLLTTSMSHSSSALLQAGLAAGCSRHLALLRCCR